MKKYIYLVMVTLIAFLPFTLTSCSSDDGEEIGNSSDIVGTWYRENTTGYGMTSDEFEYIQFKSDGTYIDVQDDEEDSKGYTVDYGKWTLSDNTINLQITTGILKGSTFSYQILTQIGH